jgi:hypothetical protein
MSSTPVTYLELGVPHPSTFTGHIDNVIGNIGSNIQSLTQAFNTISQNQSILLYKIIPDLMAKQDQIISQLNNLEEIIMSANTTPVHHIPPTTSNANNNRMVTTQYCKAEISDHELSSLSPEQLIRLRANIASTKCRYKKINQHDYVSMCELNLQKIKTFLP